MEIAEGNMQGASCLKIQTGITHSLQLRLQFGEDYPFQPPEVRFASPRRRQLLMVVD